METEMSILKEQDIIEDEITFDSNVIIDDEFVSLKSISKELRKDANAKTDGVGRTMFFDCYIPPKYHIMSGGVYKEKQSEEFGSEKRKTVYDHVCNTRLMPTGLFVNADNNTDILELTFLGDKSKETIYVPSVAILGSKEWKEHVRKNDYGRLYVLDEEITPTLRFRSSICIQLLLFHNNQNNVYPHSFLVTLEFLDLSCRNNIKRNQEEL